MSGITVLANGSVIIQPPTATAAAAALAPGVAVEPLPAQWMTLAGQVDVEAVMKEGLALAVLWTELQVLGYTETAASLVVLVWVAVRLGVTRLHDA